MTREESRNSARKRLRDKLSKLGQSNDIADAWQVLDELRAFDTAFNYRLRLSESEGRTGSSWAAVFRSSDKSIAHTGQASTAPQAIFIAASSVLRLLEEQGP